MKAKRSSGGGVSKRFSGGGVKRQSTLGGRKKDTSAMIEGEDEEGRAVPVARGKARTKRGPSPLSPK